MKRVTLNIDLEDNEIFEKEVAEAVLSFSRQAAREAVEKEVNAEIQRVVKAMLSPQNIWLRDKVRESVKTNLDAQWVHLEIFNKVSDIIREKIDLIVDQTMQKIDIKKMFDDKFFTAIRGFFTGENDGNAG